MAASLISSAPSVSASKLTSLETALDELQNALTAYRQDFASSPAYCKLIEARRAAAREVAALSRPSSRGPAHDRICTLITDLAAAGAYDFALSGEEVALANQFCAQGLSGVPAAMLLAPAWRLEKTPSLDAVPDWLQPDYARWLYLVPCGPLNQDDISRFFSFWRKVQAKLDTWLGQNPGARLVKLAIAEFLKGLTTPSHLWSTAQNDDLAPSIRGRLLARHFLRGHQTIPVDPISRDGRRLRVGFVASDFGPRSNTSTTVALFENLDSQRFEISLFALSDSQTAEAAYSAGRIGHCNVLPAENADRIAFLQGAGLDVIVFGDDIASHGAASQLSLHRIAPLQIAADPFAPALECQAIDLQLGLGECRSEKLSTRAGLLAGPAVSYAFPPLADLPDMATSRQILGLPQEIVLFASITSHQGFSAESLTAWRNVLEQAPDARLLIGVILENPDDHETVTKWTQLVDRHLASGKIDPSRIFIFPLTSKLDDELHLLLRASDYHIGGLDKRDGCWTARALSLGVPGVALEGKTASSASAILNEAGLPTLIAKDAAHLGEIGKTLSGDRQARENFVGQIQAALEAEPAFFDTLARSDAFGALIESAYDAILSSGAKAFRSSPQDFRAADVSDNIERELDLGAAALTNGESAGAGVHAQRALNNDPRNPRARYLRGKTLLAESRSDRAVTYLLAALPHYSGDINFWCTLAEALHRNGQTTQAVEALEVCLKMGGDQAPALFLILTLAESAGAHELARETLEALRKVAPADPRVLLRSF